MTEALRASGRIIESAKMQYASIGAPYCGPLPSGAPGGPPSGLSPGALPRRHLSRGPGAPELQQMGSFLDVSSGPAGGGAAARSIICAADAAREKEQQSHAPGTARRGAFRDEEVHAFRQRLGETGRPLGGPLSGAVRSQRDRQLECVAVVAKLQRASQIDESDGVELPEYLTKPIPVQMGLVTDADPLEEKRLKQLLQHLQQRITPQARREAAERKHIGRAIGTDDYFDTPSRERAHAVLPSIQQTEGRIIGTPEFLEGWAEPMCPSLCSRSTQNEPKGFVAKTPHNVASNWLRTKPCRGADHQDAQGGHPGGPPTTPNGALKKMPGMVELLCSMALERKPLPLLLLLLLLLLP